MSYLKKGEDELHSVAPDAETIVCKDCMFRNDGTIWSSEYTKGCCQMFPYPAMKPIEVLFKKGSCKKYKKEM